jgi:hypothetical protein
VIYYQVFTPNNETQSKSTEPKDSVKPKENAKEEVPELVM